MCGASKTTQVSACMRVVGVSACTHLPSRRPRPVPVARTPLLAAAAHCCNPSAGWLRSAPGGAVLPRGCTAQPRHAQSRGTGHGTAELTAGRMRGACCQRHPAAQEKHARHVCPFCLHPFAAKEGTLYKACLPACLPISSPGGTAAAAWPQRSPVWRAGLHQG